MYVTTLLGLDPFIRDPVAKFWQEQETPATKCILQFFCLALVWTNLFMLYSLIFMGASATALLKFQVLGWGSVLALNAYQVRHYGFTAQFDTLGMQMTLAALSIYISFT